MKGCCQSRVSLLKCREILTRTSGEMFQTRLRGDSSLSVFSSNHGWCGLPAVVNILAKFKIILMCHPTFNNNISVIKLILRSLQVQFVNSRYETLTN